MLYRGVKHKYNEPMSSMRTDSGMIHGSTIAVICLGLLFVVSSGLAAWAYSNYQEQKTNVDGKVAVAVATAKKDQADADEKKFVEREQQPYRQFAGPDDLGRLTFDYAKTWSVYEAVSSATGYTAYLHPLVVPVVSAQNKYALEVKIEQKDYDTVIKSYDSLVKSGKLKTSAFKVGDKTGTRFDGNINDKTRGAFVVFKIRDKTLTIQTDADIFMDQFNKLIATVKYDG
jgi:hypothetical protein